MRICFLFVCKGMYVYYQYSVQKKVQAIQSNRPRAYELGVKSTNTKNISIAKQSCKLVFHLSYYNRKFMLKQNLTISSFFYTIIFFNYFWKILKLKVFENDFFLSNCESFLLVWPCHLVSPSNVSKVLHSVSQTGEDKKSKVFFSHTISQPFKIFIWSK